MAKRIGLISGSGSFPMVFAESARSEGLEVVAVAHRGETMPELADLVDKILWIKLGQLGKLVDFFKNEGVNEVVMAGGIDKKNIYRKVWPDMKALSLWSKLRNRLDDGILRAVAGVLEDEGIKVVESTLFLKRLMAPKGTLTGKPPGESEQRDIDFGWKIAKEMGGLDIGQCIVVKDLVVVAVEAIEGTDETIRRGGRLAKRGAVVVKVLKPNQDLRFDLPAVGLQTIRTMREVEASCLAIEAGSVIMFEREEMVREADRSGIAIVAL
ncbi:MAG: UDP-2,3-diacylglucosamine diphosphatase LpxI [Pseudomonadota bacterium]